MQIGIADDMYIYILYLVTIVYNYQFGNATFGRDFFLIITVNVNIFQTLMFKLLMNKHD